MLTMPIVKYLEWAIKGGVIDDDLLPEVAHATVPPKTTDLYLLVKHLDFVGNPDTTKKCLERIIEALAGFGRKAFANRKVACVLTHYTDVRLEGFEQSGEPELRALNSLVLDPKKRVLRQTDNAPSGDTWHFVYDGGRVVPLPDPINPQNERGIGTKFYHEEYPIDRAVNRILAEMVQRFQPADLRFITGKPEEFINAGLTVGKSWLPNVANYVVANGELVNSAQTTPYWIHESKKFALFEGNMLLITQLFEGTDADWNLLRDIVDQVDIKQTFIQLHKLNEIFEELPEGYRSLKLPDYDVTENMLVAIDADGKVSPATVDAEHFTKALVFANDYVLTTTPIVYMSGTYTMHEKIPRTRDPFKVPNNVFDCVFHGNSNYHNETANTSVRTIDARQSWVPDSADLDGWLTAWSHEAVYDDPSGTLRLAPSQDILIYRKAPTVFRYDRHPNHGYYEATGNLSKLAEVIGIHKLIREAPQFNSGFFVSRTFYV